MTTTFSWGSWGSINSIGKINIGTSVGSGSTGTISIGKDSNASAINSIAIGVSCVSSGTSGVALGYQSLASGTTTTALGYQSVASGASSTACGNNANCTNTNGCAMGVSSTVTGLSSTAYGASTIAAGDGSVIVGYYSNDKPISTAYNYCVQVGYDSHAFGNGSTCLGGVTLAYQDGIAIGYAANASANGVAVGKASLVSNTGGVAIGIAAAAANNAVAIGICVSATANMVRIGGVGVTTIGGPAAWTNTSDMRIKSNIIPLDLGLKFINDLNPVKYNMQCHMMNAITKPKEDRINRINNDSKLSDEEKAAKLNELEVRYEPSSYSKQNAKNHNGLLAQEVLDTLKKHGHDALDIVYVPKDESTDLYGLGYSQFVPSLINAIKELTSQNKELLARIEVLEDK